LEWRIAEGLAAQADPALLRDFIRGSYTDIYTDTVFGTYFDLSLDPEKYREKIRRHYEERLGGYLSMHEAAEKRQAGLADSKILAYAGGKPVVKIGRIAGQYAKPRSADTEVINGVTLPSYRGDMVNGPEPTPEARRPDSRRMLQGYYNATATMNLLRAFTLGGYASLDRMHAWNNEFVKTSPMGRLTSAPRSAGMMQKLHAWLQPSEIFR